MGKRSWSPGIEDAETTALCYSLFQQLMIIIHSKCNFSSPFPWFQLPTTRFYNILHRASKNFNGWWCLIMTVLLCVNQKCLTSVWESSDLFEVFPASVPNLKFFSFNLHPQLFLNDLWDFCWVVLVFCFVLIWAKVFEPGICDLIDNVHRWNGWTVKCARI